MRRALRLPLLVPAALHLVACAVEQPVPGSPDSGDPPPGAGGAEAAVCLRGEPFVAAGAVPMAEAGPAADAREIAELRWAAHEGCERLVIGLAGEDGGPAGGAGSASAEVLRGLGVVRITLPGVERAQPDATDRSFDGPLARAAYAVRSADGRGTHVDVHLGAAAEAHVHVLTEPTRVVVDLRPGGGAVPDLPSASRQIVVLEPRPGAASFPLTVTGYARTFEANVVARLERGGEDIHETFTTATGWLDAWGHFTLVIEEGPAGPLVLHVGDYSARDGVWEGVAVALDVRAPAGDGPDPE